MSTHAIKLSTGGVAIITLLDKETTVEQEIAKWPQDQQDLVVSHRKIKRADIPKSRKYREAWTDALPGEKIDIDEDKKFEVDTRIVLTQRQQEYKDIGDQLDAIMKWIASMPAGTVPEELAGMAAHSMDVKRRFKKPAKPTKGVKK